MVEKSNLVESTICDYLACDHFVIFNFAIWSELFIWFIVRISKIESSFGGELPEFYFSGLLFLFVEGVLVSFVFQKIALVDRCIEAFDRSIR